MRLRVIFDALVISVKKQEAKNGNLYYRLSIESSDGDAGTVGCSQDIYELYVAGDIERFRTYTFEAMYNAQYGSLNVIAVSAAVE